MDVIAAGSACASLTPAGAKSVSSANPLFCSRIIRNGAGGLDALFSRILEHIQRYNMFRTGHRIGVAVSSGADSVCLLHILVELAPRWDLKLHVLHVNHGLRGEESRQDEAFVRDLSGRLGLNCRVCEAPIASGGNLEQSARRA